MAGRPSQRRHHEEEVVEINLIPLMNMICILIPFMIMAAVFVQLSIIDTSLPTAVAPGEKVEEDPAKKPKLTLTVAMSKEGFSIAGYGGVLNIASDQENAAKDKEQPPFIIPKKIVGKNPDGTDILEFDYASLQENLIKVKDKYPDQYSIILLPESHVVYQEIIDAMDTAREVRSKDASGKEITRILFPSPVLAGGMR